MGTRFSIGISDGSRSLSLRLALAAGAVFGVGGRALAQTWVGLSGVDSNWTTTGNWSGSVVPVNNGSANVIFTGSSRLTPNVNVAQDLNSLTFSTAVSPGSFNLTGLGLTLRGASAITNNTGVNQNISCPVTVFNPQTWNAAGGSLWLFGQLNINANLTLDGANFINWSGPSVGSGNVTKNGTGTWTLSGASSAPFVTVNAGTLRVGANNVLADTGLLSLAGTGILDLNGLTDTVGGLASPSASAQVLLPGNSSLTIGSANFSSSFSGTISGASTAMFTKTGTGATTLSGNNTFGGMITVANGTLATSSSERLSDSCIVFLSGNGVLSLPAGAVEHIGSIATSSGNALIDGASATLIPTSINLGGGTCNAHLSGNAELTKNNPGTFILNNTNFYNGNTRIATDTLVLAVNDAIPSNSVVTLAGGTLQLNPGISNTVGIINGTGSVVLGGGTPVSTLTCGSAIGTTFNGVISGTGDFVVAYGATEGLSGASTFTGALRLNGGSVYLYGTERLPDTCDVTIANGPSYSGVLSVDTYETVRSLTLAGGSVYGANQAPAPTTLMLTSGLNVQSGGANLTLAGPVQLIKTTTGTATLYRSNAFTGGTWLRDGVLEIYSDGALGAAGTPLALDGGRLRVLNSASIARPVTLGFSNTIEAVGDVELPNVLFGNGTLNKDGPGTLRLPNWVNIGQFNVLAGMLDIPTGCSLTVAICSTSAGGTLSIPGGIVVCNYNQLTNAGELHLSSGGRFSGAVTNNGVISGSGRIIGTVFNSASGTMRDNPGESLVVAGSLVNAGLTQVVGGSFEVTGACANQPSTGLIFARNAELHFDAGIINQGGIACSFGTTDIYGDVDNRLGGTITISGGSDATFIDDVINNGTLRTSTGGNSVFLGAVSGSGSFPGSGIVFLEGDLRPGNSPGFVSFGGDVVFGSFSSLVEELAGTNLNQFDRTAIAGTAYLDGSLDVRLYGGYIPSGIQSFTILTADQVVGQFQSVNLPLTNPPLRVIYTDTAVLISNCAADFNNDGVVDFFDYLDFVDAFSANLPTADFNQDSVIDFFDYLDFVDAFSTGC